MKVEVQISEGWFYSKTIEMPALPPKGSLMLFTLDNGNHVELNVERVVWRNDPADGYEVWCRHECELSERCEENLHDDLVRNGWKVIK